MGKIADIFRTHFPAYLEKFADKIPSQHVKAAKAIMNCRTGAYGVSLFECEECGEMHTVNNCCGDSRRLIITGLRPHSPSCQQHKNIEWVRRQKDKLLQISSGRSSTIRWRRRGSEARLTET